VNKTPTESKVYELTIPILRIILKEEIIIKYLKKKHFIILIEIAAR